MSNRTVSLLMLFVVGVMSTGALSGPALRALTPAGEPGPWLAPLLAIGCCTATFFLGRRFVLPAATAEAPVRAAVTLLLLIGGSMLAAVVVVRSVRAVVGPVPGPAPLLVLWFAALWLGVAALHRFARGGRMRSP